MYLYCGLNIQYAACAPMSISKKEINNNKDFRTNV